MSNRMESFGGFGGDRDQPEKIVRKRNVSDELMKFFAKRGKELVGVWQHKLDIYNSLFKKREEIESEIEELSQEEEELSSEIQSRSDREMPPDERYAHIELEERMAALRSKITNKDTEIEDINSNITYLEKELTKIKTKIESIAPIGDPSNN